MPDNHEKLEGKELPTVNPSQKPRRSRATLTPNTHTHETEKYSFLCIEFEDMGDEKYNSENDVDIVVQVLIYCIYKLTIKSTQRHDDSAAMRTAENSTLGSPCYPKSTHHWHPFPTERRT